MPRRLPILGLLLVSALAAAGRAGSGIVSHDLALVSTRSLPAGQKLSPARDNVVVAVRSLGFSVTVANRGNIEERGVKVTLVLDQEPSPIVLTRTIDRIARGQQRTVSFGKLGQVQFATRLPVRVAVARVPGETTVINNKATYAVIFSLG